MRIFERNEYTTSCPCGLRFCYSANEMLQGQFQCPRCHNIILLSDKEIIVSEVKPVLEMNRLTHEVPSL